MRFKDFLQYVDQNKDDMPLYLFDKDFAQKAAELAEDYQVVPASQELAAFHERCCVESRS